jgi:hypothetical protein
MMIEFWLSTKKMTFWCLVGNRTVLETAPIARKFVGQSFDNLIVWLILQGDLRVEILP